MKHINHYKNKTAIGSDTIFLLLTLLLIGLLAGQSANAKRRVEQYNLPQPQNYRDYELRVEASSRRPQVGKPVVLKAIISPEISPKDIEYQFLINGAPIHEAGMHKIHTFDETGTYKVSAVAKLGGSHLLNSPPIILHVIDSWIEPEAVITPVMLTVQAGQDAVFSSLSETDPQSRQWLYWTMSAGHRGSSEKFVIKTDKLEPGKYPIELLVKDDRKRESIAHAYLVITLDNADSDEKSENIETLSLDPSGNLQDSTYEPANIQSFQLHTSHSNRLEKMQIVFWLQNTQPGADTQLQLETGDGVVTPWSKKLRYSHRYSSFGIYTARISARTSQYMVKSNTVTVYIWPLWLPVLLIILGLLLVGIPFFRRRQRQRQAPDPILYQYHPDSGQQQLILTTEQETPAVSIAKNTDNGQIILTATKVNQDNDNNE